ncbi:hypothetical protein [Brevibacillus borstelensis]|uniref:hypothetical protein n=1 Tax=Brevibacillus borstelensis TaxID=45462 RepID=UPI00287FF3E2|nr:hypothetical protein [Brevibacillus borstelensis]WNF07490.1 hypothetical protein RFB14_08835 [Brevibacillus borstelensis]
MMPKLRPRLPGDRFGPLTDVNPSESPLTDREKIAQLERENIDLMLALTQVYEELLASRSGGTT